VKSSAEVGPDIRKQETPMKIRLLLVLLIVMGLAGLTAGQSPIHARTDAGKEVILLPDGTWKYASEGSGHNATPAKSDVYIQGVSLAKTDKANQDKPGEPATHFAPGDRKIFCVVDLNIAKVDTKVKFVWKAVDVQGADNGDFITVDYLTKPLEDRVDGHVSLPRDWPKGKYRVEIYINGELGKAVDYTIE